MKRIVVTGATGFIGKYVIKQLNSKQGEYRIVGVGRNEKELETLRRQYEIEIKQADILQPNRDWARYLEYPDYVIHLAWGFLENFRSADHFLTELPAQQIFLHSIIEGGVKSLSVAGTCFEYGLQEGELTEDAPLQPVLEYAKAKVALYLFLSDLCQKYSYSLKWLRYFYMYGNGQSSNSILPLLNSAITRGDEVFKMSGGKQVRDYLSVEEVALLTVKVALQNEYEGAVNICSGKPVTILDLVKKQVERRKSNITLETGYYPYPDYEPMAFWGNTEKLRKAVCFYNTTRE